MLKPMPNLKIVDSMQGLIRFFRDRSQVDFREVSDARLLSLMQRRNDQRFRAESFGGDRRHDGLLRGVGVRAKTIE